MRTRSLLRKLLTPLLGVLLIGSGTLGIFPLSARAASGPNWDGAWGNYANTNNSPQTTITPSNVANLQVSWLFPFPAQTRTPQPELYVVGFLDTYQGPGSPPIIHNGIVYENTVGFDVYAFDAASGKVLWHKPITLSNDAK